MGVGGYYVETRNAIELNSRDVRMLVAGRDLHQEALDFFCDTYGAGSKFADIEDMIAFTKSISSSRYFYREGLCPRDWGAWRILRVRSKPTRNPP